jgi:pyruvate,water dikinase
MPSLIRPTKTECRLLADPQQEVARKYRYFRQFLDHNRGCLQLIAALEGLYYRGEGCATVEIRRLLGRLEAETTGLIESLGALSGRDLGELRALCGSIFSASRGLFEPQAGPLPHPNTVPLEGFISQSAAAVGSKAANLSLMRNAIGLPVPDGFLITTAAEAGFLEESGLSTLIRETLDRIDPADMDAAEALCDGLRHRITDAPVPAVIEGEMVAAFDSLEARAGRKTLIAVRSSAVGEDTAASFAGLYHTELGVARQGLCAAYKKVIASRFALRAVLYRRRHGFAAHDAPMGVVCLRMVDAVVSGVSYTVDPLRPDSDIMTLAVVAGGGERLVGGEASAFAYQVEKKSGRVLKTQIGSMAEEAESISKAVGDPALGRLCRMALELEAYFGGPQDIEWAMDARGEIFVLQSRPLNLHRNPGPETGEPRGLEGKAVLLSGGVAASPGVASGSICHIPAAPGRRLPEDAILVARSASIDCVAHLRQARGIITDIGSPASHLATVARELGLPAIFDTREATRLLREGEGVTMAAETCRVYQGILEEAARPPARGPDPVFGSPVFLRLRDVLERVATLTLGAAGDGSFSSAACRTVHDIVRFCHELCLRSMFGLTGAAGGSVVSGKLNFNIPIRLSFIDLGGGLQDGLTTCDGITPESIRSVPMRAFWRGLSHPGINWTSAVGLDLRNLATLMSASAGGGGPPGGDSYALVSRDYLNISIKFGYHYCNVDSLCGADPGGNHVSLQFAGGVGSYTGKVLRVAFLSRVLTRLGFSVTVTGDTISASLKGLDRGAQEQALDQLGRLLASSRLLDLGIRGQADIDRMEGAFFKGEYDYMNLERAYALPGFYLPEGDWARQDGAGGVRLIQDGSKWAGRFTLALARRLNRMIGARTQQVLDNIQAYFHFPLAIAKDVFVSEGVVRVAVLAAGGVIDQAAGLAFGIRNVGNYFVFRLNSLEHNLILFEYVNNRRIERRAVARPLTPGRWYRLSVQIQGRSLAAGLDGQEVLTYDADRPLDGYVGLWTKADSITWFEDFEALPAGAKDGIDLFKAMKETST